MNNLPATDELPAAPWVKIRRKAVDKAPPTAAQWVYLTRSRGGREHLTAPVERVAWPQGCDQCRQVILPTAPPGVRSFQVSRGPSPTTLYLCADCVSELCRSSGIPAPAPGH